MPKGRSWTRAPALRFILLVLSAILVIGGLIGEEPKAVAAATGFLGLAGFLSTELSAMSFYLLANGIEFGFANLAAYLSVGTSAEKEFYLYAIPQYIPQAQIIAFLGVAVPFLAWKLPPLKRLGVRLPGLGRPMPPTRWYVLRLVLLLGTIIPRHVTVIPQLGSITALTSSGILFVIYSLSSESVDGSVGQRRWKFGLALVLTFYEALWQLLFGYLRTGMLLPLVALAYPLVRQGRRMLGRLLVPGLAITLLFYLAGDIGRLRSEVSGFARLSRLSERFLETNDDESSKWWPAVARFSTFNQLTQVVHLVERDGFRDGETLSYLGYAFIPRALWPGKPLIALGAWFALQTGNAYINMQGAINNSVNMTLPGEFYLNFGYLGIVIGMTLFAILTQVLWESCEVDGRNRGRNSAGLFFSFYLLWAGLGWADSQMFVTLSAMYLLFFLFTLFSGARATSRTANA